MPRHVASSATLFAVLAAGVSLPLFARSEPVPGPDAWCGTRPALPAVEVARRQLFERRAARDLEPRGARGSTPTSRGPEVVKKGSIAVIQDDGTLVSRPNPFDLDERAFLFQWSKRGYKARTSGVGFDASDLGQRLTIGDDDSVTLDLPFEVRFYGERYDRLFVNSDGNLTFVEAESSSAARSVSRFLAGPPRLAGLFTDLDPSSATGTGGVYYRELPSGVRLTWLDVPEFGVANHNSFQMTISKNGKIVVVYDAVDAADAVVGISPGGEDALLELIDVDEDLPLPPQPFDVAIAAKFNQQGEVDDFGIVKTFFSEFRDVYDDVIVYLDFPYILNGDPLVWAFHFGIKNEVRGIGLGDFDYTDIAGSGGRLESYVQMGFVDRYPDDLHQELFGTNDAVDVLAHEAGHRWLARLRFRDSSGAISTDLLGRQQSHWSFFFNSEGSLLEGNEIRDNGDGTFTTIDGTYQYCDLDLYQMGLLPPEQVGPFWYVDGSGSTAEANPQRNVTLRGTRVNLTLDDVLAVEGPRVPEAADAPKAFNMAFVIVGREGEPISQASIAKVDRLRKEFIAYFYEATAGLAKVRTTLRRNPRR